MQDVVMELMSLLGIPSPSLGDMIGAAAAIGIDQDNLTADLESVVRERIYMWLVSHVDGQLNFLERKNVVRNQLESTVDPTLLQASDVVDRLVRVIASAQARVAEARTTGKSGKASVHRDQWDRLLRDQGYRCDICGVPLSARVRGACGRFEDGLEPIGDPTLDHILPFYMGSNIDNVQVLCRDCNGIKNDLVGVQEDGVVLSGNFLRERSREHVRRRMMFWTLWRDRTCADSACRNGRRSRLMFVSRHSSERPFAYGNLSVYCGDHAPPDARWIHEE